MEKWQVFLMGVWIGVLLGAFILSFVHLARESLE